jgi:hypothetical protein
VLKAVIDDGFDARPDLRAKVAAAVPVVADELDGSGTDIALTFRGTDGSAVQVELTDASYGRRTDAWPARYADRIRMCIPRARARTSRSASNVPAGQASVRRP